MPVTYVLAQKGLPGTPGEEKKFYAQAKARGELTYRQLAKEIADASTTVSDSDVLAVLNDLTKVLKRHLSNGEIVRFGDFGSFQITLTSEGVLEESKFNASLIKGAKIAFRPGIDLREMLSALQYEKIS